MTWRYELPCGRTIPGKLRKSLDEWFLKFLPLDPKQVSSTLARTWQGLKKPLSVLCDHLLPVRNAYLVGLEGEAFVQVCRGVPYTADSDLPEDDLWMSMYLRPSQDRDRVLRMMKKFGLPVSDSFVEFNCVFAGLRESEPNLAGGFLLVDEWKTFRDRLGKYASYREPAQLKKWGDSVVVFHARNGNHVLMNPDGKLAWDVMQEQRVDEKWKSFDEFIEHYADYLDYNWPFDSYGPDEGRKKRRP